MVQPADGDLARTRLVTASGDEVTDDVSDAIKVKSDATNPLSIEVIGEHGVAVISGQIVSGGTESEQFDTEGYGLAGLIIPSITSGAIKFKVSPVSGGTFVDLKNAGGVALSVTWTSGLSAVSDAEVLNALIPWRYVKIITEVQADGRHLKFVTRA